MDQSTVNQYISKFNRPSVFVSEEEFVKNTAIKDYCPVIDTNTAVLLSLLLEIKRPQRVLELGTSIGYSTTIIASTISSWGGTVTTVEFDKRVAEQAKENFERYGVAKNIELINEDVFKAIPALDQQYDLIYLDLFNDLYPDLLEVCVGLLDKEGILIADDTLSPVMPEHDSCPKMDTFNRLVASHSQLKSVMIPMDDGITVAVKA